MPVCVGDRRKRNAIDTGEQLHGVAGVQHFGQKRVKRRVGRLIDRRRGTAHLGDSAAQRIDVLGALPLM